MAASRILRCAEMVVNEPKDQQEPSMEEILSSIRRIIADEEGEERDTDEAERLDAAALSEDRDEGENDDDDEDDVLELTEVVRESDGVVDLQAEREAHAEEGPVEFETAADEPVEEEPEEAVGEPDEVELLPGEEHAVAEEAPEVPPPPATPATPARPSGAVGEGLVSSVAAGATAGAFAKLNQAMHPESKGEAPVPESDRSIEAFLADLLRPMLREWLEENLPPMVERLVAQEIEKLAKRAELL